MSLSLFERDASLTFDAFFSSSVCRIFLPSRSCSRCCCRRALALRKRRDPSISEEKVRRTNLFGNGVEGVFLGERAVVLILSFAGSRHRSRFSISTRCRRTHHIASGRVLWSRAKFMITRREKMERGRKDVINNNNENR